MWKNSILIIFNFLILSFVTESSSAFKLTQEEYEEIITFTIFSEDLSKRVNSTFGSDPFSQGCDANGLYSFVVHGWQENIKTLWVRSIVNRLLEYRGGCVIVMDYSQVPKSDNYYYLYTQFEEISAVLLKKVNQIGSYERQFLFGFSFGARLVMDVGLNVGNQLIDRIDACEPAKPYFDNTVDPKPAAKNVQCIHTSNNYGTDTYNCHQDFRMGYLGHSQRASGAFPLGSHGLCPYMYNLAFEHEYVPYNYYKTTSTREAPLTADVRMGYLGDYNRTYVQGDIFITTAQHPPYVMNEKIPFDNRFETLKHFAYGKLTGEPTENYEEDIKFYLYKTSYNDPVISTFDISIEGQGCDPNGYFSVIVHGWQEYPNTSWVQVTVENLLLHRGGCVFLMDYSEYSQLQYDFQLTPHFEGIANVLIEKIKQIGNYENQFCYGVGFGGRLCIGAGHAIGNQKIGRIDACDPARSGFDNAADPKPAAKNVACINTSHDKGTWIYNCHQNFIMGRCGSSQDAGATFPLGHQGMCPYLYNMAFYYDYTSNNAFGCHSHRLAPAEASNVKMGYLGDFNRKTRCLNNRRSHIQMQDEEQISFGCLTALTQEEYECSVVFFVFNSTTVPPIISPSNEPIDEEVCGPDGNFTIIIHGWMEGIHTPWLPNTVHNFLVHRGGCVVVVDYSKFSNNTNYFALTPHFQGISDVIREKMEQIGNLAQQFCFGFSFGARLCMDIGLAIGNQELGRIDACEPAGPGFDNNVDPTEAAKTVACINTSKSYGTSVYNCHQNFIMGNCGHLQPAAGSFPLGDHGLCPYFYNMAFYYDFVPNNLYDCATIRPINGTDIKFGPLANLTNVYGDIYIATAEYPPYVVIDGVIDNLIPFLHDCDEYEDNVEFVVYRDDESFISNFNDPISQQGCDINGNFSIVTHGWLGSQSLWIKDLISNLKVYRHGCVIFMNYSYYSDRENYLDVLSHFKPVSNLLTRKLNQLSNDNISDDNIFMFGFSFGGRVVIEAALNYGSNRIHQIDVCDMAGPGFDYIYRRDPKEAAKNVQCIHTSDNAGTKIRNCHQNWLMGYCGISQPAGNDIEAILCELFQACEDRSPAPINNHSLCPHFYNSAFENNFIADNPFHCPSQRMAKNLPEDFKMGFMEKRKRTRQREITTFDKDLSMHGCEADGNYAMVVHGLRENLMTPWVMDTVNNLMDYRGGCVIFMDYSNFSTVLDYYRLVYRFYFIADVLLKKVKQIGNYDRLFMFGFSFGARLCFEVGTKIGNQLIERIDGCDPAGPGFTNLLTVDPKLAAKNVACINTSVDRGTGIYNCHQNFLMGKCGRHQPAATTRPLGSHGLCPYFYNAAFENDFLPNNYFNCSSKREVQNMPNDIKMGYNEKRLTPDISGEIFVATGINYPWNEV
ncbi:CLUMA_CG015386, isoform A [Clunio marinus]|uniref:CLUMA_CG015386, isoform A n=1 Tax=Clunio marinus TaxID=568069 RepID=A0A1J1ISJ2_9DIPT|nr:CLUMA_CG015386, isoform A [Clunio marinus]